MDELVGKIFQFISQKDSSSLDTVLSKHPGLIDSYFDIKLKGIVALGSFTPILWAFYICHFESIEVIFKYSPDTAKTILKGKNQGKTLLQMAKEQNFSGRTLLSVYNNYVRKKKNIMDSDPQKNINTFEIESNKIGEEDQEEDISTMTYPNILIDPKSSHYKSLTRSKKKYRSQSHKFSNHTKLRRNESTPIINNLNNTSNLNPIATKKPREKSRSITESSESSPNKTEELLTSNSNKTSQKESRNRSRSPSTEDTLKQHPKPKNLSASIASHSFRRIGRPFSYIEHTQPETTTLPKIYYEPEGGFLPRALTTIESPTSDPEGRNSDPHNTSSPSLPVISVSELPPSQKKTLNVSSSLEDSLSLELPGILKDIKTPRDTNPAASESSIDFSLNFDESGLASQALVNHRISDPSLPSSEKLSFTHQYKDSDEGETAAESWNESLSKNVSDEETIGEKKPSLTGFEKYRNHHSEPQMNTRIKARPERRKTMGPMNTLTSPISPEKSSSKTVQRNISIFTVRRKSETSPKSKGKITQGLISPEQPKKKKK